MKSTAPLTFILLLLFFSCSTNQNQPPPLYAPEVVEAKGYKVPEDSIGKPEIVEVTNPQVTPAGKLKRVLIKSNTYLAGIPTVVPAAESQVFTPGQGNFSVPKPVIANGIKVSAGVPDVVLAKEAFTSDKTSDKFTSIGRSHGLKSLNITWLLEDKRGNLWLGTGDEGLIRYDGKSFTNFSVRQGLSNDYLTNIQEDKNGNLWFGTSGKGVSMYDGKSFTHFSESEGLSQNYVRSMLLDTFGILWVGTGAGGVDMYDGTTFKHFTAKEGFTNDIVWCMIEDKNGNVWFGRTGGVSKFDRKSFIHITDQQNLNRKPVVSMLEDHKGNFWLGTEGGGVIMYDSTSFSHLTVEDGLGDDFITSVQQDAKGDFWFGTMKSGLTKYDGKNFTRFTENEGLSSNGVISMLKDKRDNLWVGTAEGLSKYSGSRLTHFTEKEGLNNPGWSLNGISTILEDKSGNLWISTYDGGVNRFDGKNFSHLTDSQGMSSPSITCMTVDNAGDLWLGHYGSVEKYNGTSFINFKVGKDGPKIAPLCVMPDRDGNIWIGSFMLGVSRFNGKTFTYFTEKQGLSHNIIMCMLQDRKGLFWFGTHGGGICRYDGKNFTHFTEKGGLSDNQVTSLFEDGYDNLWIGTVNGGVNKYNGSSFVHFKEKDGLASNRVKSIMEDSRGNLWFATDVGLSMLAKEKLAILSKDSPDRTSLVTKGDPLFKNYTNEDGFPGIEADRGNTLFGAKDGTIWMGTRSRLTAYHPGEDTIDTIPPNIQLTGVALYNESIPWQYLTGHDPAYTGKHQVKDTSILLGNGVRVHDVRFDSVNKWYGLPGHLSLAYDNNYLTFQYVGISIQSPKKVKYQYKLEGFDQNWSALTNRNEANYGNLPHGKYTFKVKAMNGDGYWSNEYHYSFTIRPPWWHTWWAYTLFVLLSAGIIYSLFRYRLNKIRINHQFAVQQHKVTELEMQALRAQMNPHFIFNSLNSINLFILENNKLQASEYLSKFSRLVRLILNNSRETFIPLEQELEALELYLELESLRFNQKFKYEIKVDSSLDASELKVPPLIIQPYAENAIWHGLMNKKDKGHLEISLYQEEKNLFCKICDDGIGRKKAAEIKSKSTSTRKSVGMEITAERIAMFQHQGESSTPVMVRDVVLPDGSPGGTEVIITIPFRS